MTIWFTSDEHHGHANIIKYCGRHFKNTDVMTARIIEAHNAVVKPEDVVYHLGDFSMHGPEQLPFFRRILRKYAPVAERHLILGNHDRLDPFQYIDLGFTAVHTSLWVGDAFLNHDPAVYQKGCSARLCIHGHVHGLWAKINRLHNVGVDVRFFAPVSLDTIIAESKDGS